MSARLPLPMHERVRLFDRAMRELLALTTARLTSQQQPQQAESPVEEDRR
jgi:hypothetical protein